MDKAESKKPEKKNHRALRRLVGTVAIAGATYAAEKFIESRKHKKASGRQK